MSTGQQYGLEADEFDAEFVRKILRAEMRRTGKLIEQYKDTWKQHTGTMRSEGRKTENDVRRKYAALKMLERAVDQCEAILTSSGDGPRLEA